MRVLLVEPDASTAAAIELMLTVEGFKVYTTDLGEEAVELSKLYAYDAVILDLTLPDMSGLEVLRQIRTAKVKSGVVMLAHDERVETKVRAFHAGCDDYICRPFHKDELSVRLGAIIRRAGGHVSSKVTFANVEVDLDQKRVKVGGEFVHLTGKEYQLLELLVLRSGTTLSKEAFLNHLYGGMDEPELKIIDVFICKLRKKMEAAGSGKHIQTIWGRGYTLVMDPEDIPPPKREASAAAPPPREPLETRTGRLLRLLGDGPATSHELAIGLHMRMPNAVALAKKQIDRGLVVNRGRPRSSLFSLTPTGVAWLETQGFEVPAEVKTAVNTASTARRAAAEALAERGLRRPVGLPSRESAL